MDILHSLLAKLGLSENQRKAYLSLLSLGSAPVSTIASKAGIHRITCNDCLKQLQSMWFVLPIKKNSTTIYTAKEPESIIEQQELLLEQLQKSIPLFHLLTEHSSAKPILSYFQHIEEVKKNYLLMLKESNWTIYSILWSRISNMEILEFIDGEFEQKRISLWIIQKVICSTNSDIKTVDQNSRLREKLHINSELFSPECGIHIYWNNKIMVTFLMGDSCSLATIENVFLYKTLQNIFMVLWQQFTLK